MVEKSQFCGEQVDGSIFSIPKQKALGQWKGEEGNSNPKFPSLSSISLYQKKNH